VSDASKKLRAAVHRLLCHTVDTPRGVLVKRGFVNALDRALDAADAEADDRRCSPTGQCPYHASGGPETVRCGSDGYLPGVSRVAGKVLRPVPPEES